MTTDPKQLSQVYGKGYYHGDGSGYPENGYAQAHPSWKEYIDFIYSVKGNRIKWLDVGCAYGYLLKEAKGKGIAAFGADISTYALKQLSEIRPALAQSLAENLPFRSASFDVLTAFDLVEHLYDPKAGLKEMTRVLKPGGILLLSTPDPLLFDRKEETHHHERPPSFWMEQMRRLGFRARLRFFGEPYNLEIMAIKDEDEAKAETILKDFNHDNFGKSTDILTGSFATHQLVLRKGWSKLHPHLPARSVRYFNGGASLYFCNGGENPVEVDITLTLDEDARLRFYTQLEQFGVERVAQKEGLWVVNTDKFYLPPGGHEIEILCEDNRNVEVREITFEVTEKDFSEYNLTLPIDQYQRYRVLQQSIELLPENKHPRRILEVGGTPGQILGFLPEDDITIVDLEHCDIPQFQPADGLKLPFQNGEFDIVVSIDVFEHVLPKNREAFLFELARVSNEFLVVGAPFDNPAVRDAERILFEFVHTKRYQWHRFLGEHLRHSLPDKEETARLLNNLGLHTITLPNGYLSHWLLMMMIYYYLEADPRLNRVRRLINRYYNVHHYPHDNRPPAYRHLLIASKSSLTEKTQEALGSLVSPGEVRDPISFTSSVLLLELVNVDLLNKSADLLKEKDGTIRNLITRTENLEKVINEKDKSLERQADNNKKLQEAVKDLETRLLASLEQNGFLAGRIKGLESSLDSSCKENQTLKQHTRNLERIVNHPSVKLLRSLKQLFTLRRP